MLRLLLVGFMAATMTGLWASDVLAQRDAGAKARGDYGRGFWSQYDRSPRGGSFYYQPAGPSEESYRSFSYQPINIHAGDNVAVRGQGVRLMLGNDVVGIIPQGMNFKVTKEVNGWLGAVVDMDGQQMKGWVWHANVRQAAPEAAIVEPQAVEPQEFRRFSYEPSPQPQRRTSTKRLSPPEVRLHPGIGR